MSTVEQLSLDAAATARASDPSTSHDAAASLDPDTMHVELRRVYADIATRYNGATAGEITARFRAQGLHRERGSIARRITDLRKGGLICDTGQVRRADRKGARDEIVWSVVP